MAASDDAAAKYGAIGATVQSVPELKGIFDRAVAEEWTPDRFAMEVQNTEWWRTHSDTYRSVITRAATDPTGWEQDLHNGAVSVRQLANRMGYTVDSEDTARGIARDAAMYDWSDDQIRAAVASRMSMQGGAEGGFGGESATLISQMQKLSQDYGVRADTSQNIAQWAGDIQAGTKTIEQYQELAKASAISAYPGIRSMIESGLTVRDIASPYISTYAQLLEVNPNGVDFQNNTLIKRALQGTGTNVDANGVPSQLPLWQFEQQVKKDPAWGYTKNARVEVDGYVNTIGKQFGFIS